jgi:ATP-binding cassette subfamily B protein
MRMYDVQAGEICVEEQPIKSLNLMQYRSQIGFVPQEVFLFSDTIKSNILFGKENSSEEDLIAAADDAGVVFVPFEHVEAVLLEAERIDGGDRKQKSDIANGIDLATLAQTKYK